MKEININDTFYTITHDDNTLKEALIEFGFAPMREAAAYQTMGRVMTLKNAMKHIDKDIESLIIYLEEKGIEVSFYE